MTEISRFFRQEHIRIIPLTVKHILEDTISEKL
jgi:hypothetical protein